VKFEPLLLKSKLAPPQLRSKVNYPSYRSSLLRYLFPRTRQSARSQFSRFRLDTLPYYKHRAQSNIYRFVVARQQRKTAGFGFLTYIRRQSRRICREAHTDNATSARPKMTQLGSYGNSGGYGGPGYNSLGGAPPEGRERGSRRKKLAGYLKVANELRQSYQQSYSASWGNRGTDDAEEYVDIPGAFPDAAIVKHGDEELVLFPS
jgi:hypothetical protein